MTFLNGSAFNIYRHASEVVHGSYYSACYFWGLTMPGRPAPTSTGDLQLTLVDHQFSILLSTVFAYVGLVECFADYTNKPDLAEEARSQIGQLKAFPAIAETLAK